MLFQTKAKKMAASSSSLPLPPWPPPTCFRLDKHIESVSSFIYLSSAWFVSDPVAMVSAPAWGRTCVYCIYDGMLRKERADWSAGALWCHIQVCETLCFICYRRLRPLLRKMPREQEAIWQDGPHNSNWIGCTTNTHWPQAWDQTSWVYFCKGLSVVCYNCLL